MVGRTSILSIHREPWNLCHLMHHDNYFPHCWWIYTPIVGYIKVLSKYMVINSCIVIHYDMVNIHYYTCINNVTAAILVTRTSTPRVLGVPRCSSGDPLSKDRQLGTSSDVGLELDRLRPDTKKRKSWWIFRDVGPGKWWEEPWKTMGKYGDLMWFILNMAQSK